jgi:serine protease AprX
MKRFVLLVMIVLVSVHCFADPTKLSPDLQKSTAPTARVVVQYNSQPSLLDLNLLSTLGSILNALPLVNGIVAELPLSNILSLSNQSNVKYISLDRTLTPTLSNAAPAVNAFAAWQSGYTGSGIGVALIDSGVASHPDLNGGLLGLSRVVWNQSFVTGNASAVDQYGHGTHIAGLIAGNGSSSTGSKYSQTFKGIAPQANLINLRVLDQNGAGTDSAVIAAINQAISLKPLFNIRVINLSLGRPVFESYKLDPVCQAVEAAWKSGIVVVVAAGNNGRYQPTDGYATITSPGNDPYVITVGAMKTMGTPTRVDDLIASYSSKGPTVVDAIAKPDIVAPGNLLVSLEAPNSTLYNEYPGNRVPNSFYTVGGTSAPSSSYFTLSGTSMATGVVSGVVADLLQKSPSLTPDQVKARLMKTAWKSLPAFSSTTDPVSGITYTDQYDVFTVGAGYIDVEAAITSTDVAKGTAMSPVASYDSTTGNVYLNDSSTPPLSGIPRRHGRTPPCGERPNSSPELRRQR